jgi:transcriptional regulator with PAS, ATPase and Fis domain
VSQLITEDVDDGGGAAARFVRRTLGLYVIDTPDERTLDRFVAASPVLEIGREPGSGHRLAINDTRMSRTHTRLRAVKGRLTLEDCGSRNGTFLNGARLVEPTPVGPGDLVRLGETLLEVCELDPDAPPPLTTGPLLTRDPELLVTVAILDRAAPAALPVLLLGETGTGKEVLARRLHERSGRPGAFAAVNCAAIPADLVEAQLFGHRRGAFTGAIADTSGIFLRAHRGTLFLDEVGELPLEVQAKLLRVLETGEVPRLGADSVEPVQVRVVAATNADLEERIAKGTFRNDLFARLAGVARTLPPLRDRRRDVPLLARALLARAAPTRRLVLRAAFVEGLVLHAWPRNVRELKMAMERVAVLADDAPVGAEALELALPTAAASGPGGRRAGGPSRDELVALLQQHRGNVAQVASVLGCHARQVYRWFQRHALDVNEYRQRR